MSSLFISVDITPEAANDPALAERLAELCPVDIFSPGKAATLTVVQENVDECVLCGLCLSEAPAGAITVRKLYDDGSQL